MTGWLEDCPYCEGGRTRNACPECGSEGAIEVEHPELDAQVDESVPDEELGFVVYPPALWRIWLRQLRSPDFGRLRMHRPEADL